LDFEPQRLKLGISAGNKPVPRSPAMRRRFADRYAGDGDDALATP
jgi:hypothetical protein